ncbi:MAG: hypothetical protein DDT22_00247 [candidate division WS2 bacterium]|nr:hypothetical protein [Bacillota bacterium]MBT9174587.1 hypothetical protein [Candidatus Lithacetigena glycinireducens]
MKENFEKAFAFIIKVEGGYVNNPVDPGGETKYGISKKAYPNLDIKNLTLEDVKKIYYRDYWQKAACDELAYPWDIIIFDTGVNCGVRTALRLKSSSTNIESYLLLRIEYHKKITVRNPKLLTFIIGWINRIMKLYRLCK